MASSRRAATTAAWRRLPHATNSSRLRVDVSRSTDMELLTTGLHFSAGWAFWSLSHYVGHRWWHDDMKKGKQTFYAHGERQHHRLYDGDDQAFMRAEDPGE